MFLLTVQTASRSVTSAFQHCAFEPVPFPKIMWRNCSVLFRSVPRVSSKRSLGTGCAEQVSQKDTTRDSKKSSPFVGSPIPLVSIINSSTHPAPPSFCLAIVYSWALLKAKTWELGSSNRKWKQALGGEWSHPLFSRPQVRSSKGPKPVVMWWLERVLPWGPAFLSIFPNETAAYFVITALPI